LHGDIFILIAFRWTESESVFTTLLSDSKYNGVRKEILAQFAKEVAWDGGSGRARVEEDPFITRHRLIYRQLMSDSDISLRANATILYFSTARDVDEIENLIGLAINDKDDRIATIGAQAAANFVIMNFGPLMEERYDNSKGALKSVFCHSARVLGRPINCTQ
jgi:hypothetical protein